jgi:hypothetical protein
MWWCFFHPAPPDDLRRRKMSKVEIAFAGRPLRVALYFDEANGTATANMRNLWIALKATPGVELSYWKPAPGGRLKRHA